MTILHFSHANGFPAACYRKMFSYLGRDFEIRYVNTIGHDPRHPVTDSWPHLVAEQIEQIGRYREPVLGVGHSRGEQAAAPAARRVPALGRAHGLPHPPTLRACPRTVVTVPSDPRRAARTPP